ncbi:K02A2.6-like [Cordylochernes scorpioides]|uniref:RNA-directed DNA polymerase n=1 Tax=Cordylochernes scorpioides TaxID=51811 RepID=A0ABY6LY58_9ARAC|nr:K02A2.6-like [Cordylochernes scorpioides]
MQDPAQERIMAEESAKPQHGATIGRDASSDPVVLNPNIDIPKYDGTEDPRPWIESLEEIGFLYHWADYIISRYAAMNMTGSAKTWLNLHKASFTSWENIKIRLIQDFSLDANKEELRMKLNRMQHWNEPAIRFAEDILVLCNKVDPAMEEETKIEHVIGGLKKEYSFALYLNPPKTTDDLLVVCKKMDSFEKKYRERVEKSRNLYNGPRYFRPQQQSRYVPPTAARNYQTTSRPQAPVSNNYKNDSPPTPRQYRNNFPQPSTPRRPYNPNFVPKPNLQKNTYNKSQEVSKNRTEDGRPICFKCNKPGHVARYCRVKFIRILEEDPADTQEKVEEKCQMNEMSEKSGPRLYADIFRVGRFKLSVAPESVNQSKSTINGIKELDPKYKLKINVDKIGTFEALVDTGADLSVVDLRTALDTGHGISKLAKICAGPDGKKLDMVGSIFLNIKIDDETLSHNFVILKTHLRTLILGRDFLKKMNAKIDCKQETIKYDLTNNHDEINFEMLKIKSAKDSIVPECSIKLIKALVETEDGEYIIEESSKMFQTNGLRLARSLINVINRETHIWITNPYPRPLKIMKNQTLAFGSSPAKINVSREREVEENEEPRFQINENLSPKEQKELKQVLERYGDLFSSRLGRTNLAKHRIDTEDAKPIKHKPYRVSAKERDIIKEQIDEMLTEGIIRPSSSPWSFPVILVKKRDGKYRFCVDYRKLNNVTVKDVYPIPRIDEVMDTLQGSTHFSAIDLRSGYWQVEVEERDKEKTAFTTAHGLYEFNVMPFGLCNAPATFERNMENMLGNLRWQICLCYLDDVIIYSPDFPTHLKRLEAVFRCFRESNLRLNDKKCRFAFEELEILGYITSKHGIKPAEHNIKAVRNFPRPKKVKEVQSFLGMCSYYRKFIKDFSKIADPLTNLISDMESRLRRLENNVADVPVATPLSFRIADNSPQLETTECFSKIKPPTYDGQTSWKSFKTQFEVVALGNRWNSSEKAINLAASLRGSATEVLQSRPLEQSLDYECLVHALTLRFGDDILQPYHVVKLKNRRQKRDETLQELAADVERLARLAFPDCPRHVQDLLAHQNFVDAIEDPECQQSVRMSEAKTLQEALIHSLKFEAARDATRGYQKVVRVMKTDESQKDGDIKEAIYQLQRTVEEMKKSMSFSESAPGTYRQRTYRPNDKTICWNCGKPGHIRANCRDSYPLPRIDATLDTLSGSQWFSTLDLKSGYWQVSIHPEDREKTAFTTGNGLWQFKVMPFGLCNAPATFERLMETVRQGIPLETCLVYLDDIIVMGKSFDEHLINLERVLQKIRGARLKLNPRKCKLLKEKVRYLGHVISRQGIQTDPDRTETVRQWPVPRDVHQLRSFLGLCSYYRRFVPGFSNIARPLHRLTESGRPFSWTIDCERAMDKLKQALSSPPMLAYPDPGEPFILDTDASNTGIGAVLSQTQDGVERVIAYFSKTLSKPERNYCVTRRELLAIVKSIEHFHHYLYGQKFLLRTDHAALRWLRPCPVNCKHCSKAETQAELNIRQLSLAEELKLDEWSPEEMRKSQFEDADLRPVMNWLNAGTNRPAWEDVASCSPITKSYWSLWDSLEFRGGVRYRKWESDDGQHIEWKMILPQSRVPSVLKELHNSPSGGHFGIAKTLGKVKERFYWAGCRASVEKWVRQCTECASRKGPKTRSRAKLKTYNVGAPFERIAIDIMGPLPRSDKGNRYILVAMDYFTKWPEAFPLADQEAETVAETLISQFFSRFGVPMQIHTDQGRNFESRLFAQMCKLLGSHKTRTTPLHPQSDGMVERFNRTLASQLSLFVAQNQRDWDSQLPILLMAYRSSVHETTGYSPAKMLFGRELKLPCDLIFGCPNSFGEGSNEFVDRLHSRLEKVHRWAREKLEIASEAMKVRYDTHACGNDLQEGGQVWLYNPKKKKGLSPKLQKSWEGPFRIVKKLNDVVFRIQRSSHSKPKSRNIIKKSVSFTWTERQEEAFQTLKTALLSPPILGHFNPNAPTYVHTDASNIGIGATLVQDIGGEEKVISYLSRTLSKAEQNYSTTEKECLAVVWSMSKLRPYLYGRHFKIVTDHHALCWLKNLKDPTGKKHLDADGLSRGPLPETDWDEDFERLFLNQITDEEDKFIENVKKNLNGSRRSIAQNFKVEDGCLFKKNPNPEGRAWLLVVPEKKKREIMKEYHNHMSNGHLGVARTMYRIKSKYFWPSMLKDVSEFVKTCHLCQSRKGSNQLPSGLLQPIPPANFPFERIGIDFVGPLPSTKNRKKWIIVLTDYYTRYAETKAVSEATVKEVSKFLVEDIFLRHGAPQYLISDRGSQFTSNLMKEVMKTCKIKHCFTTSYHPQTNGLTERLNRTLINMLSMYVNTDQKNWDEILPFITHAYNTTIQETTGYSPFFLMFGREPTSLLDDRNISVDIDKDDYDEYIKHHLDKINRTRKLVINNTIKTQERMKKNYDKKHMERSYEPGELVAVWTPIRKIGKCEKLLRKYFGPYRILKKLSNVNYLIEPKDNPGQDPLIVHVSRIKPYFERIDEVNHEDVTTSGEGEVLHHD